MPPRLHNSMCMFSPYMVSVYIAQFQRSNKLPMLPPDGREEKTHCANTATHHDLTLTEEPCRRRPRAKDTHPRC